MLTCPMCKKTVPETTRHCPRCATDLSLLTDFLGHLHSGLARADELTRQGRLGDAVWAYLEVLEVDPENPTARKKVGQVVTAVRQFDRSAPGRRWVERLRRHARFRQWLDAWQPRSPLQVAAVALLAVAALAVGFSLGYYCGSPRIPETPAEAPTAMVPAGNPRISAEGPPAGSAR